VIRIVLADDHAILRAGVKALLATQPDLQVVGEAGDGEHTLQLARDLTPDVVVLDVTMPGNEQLGLLRALRAQVPATRVLLLTMHQDEALFREAFRLGAAGFVLKKAAASDLISAIRVVAAGEAFVDPTMTRAVIQWCLRPNQRPSVGSPAGLAGLTPREAEVLKFAAEGYTNKEIADRLQISVKTVETHKAHIAEKLGTSSRVAWLRYAREQGLLT
jgi:DNA-binding NarL/FixJ family response regulator